MFGQLSNNVPSQQNIYKPRNKDCRFSHACPLVQSGFSVWEGVKGFDFENSSAHFFFYNNFNFIIIKFLSFILDFYFGFLFWIFVRVREGGGRGRRKRRRKGRRRGERGGEKEVYVS